MNNTHVKHEQAMHMHTSIYTLFVIIMLFYIVLRDTHALMPRDLYFSFDVNVCLTY